MRDQKRFREANGWPGEEEMDAPAEVTEDQPDGVGATAEASEGEVSTSPPEPEEGGRADELEVLRDRYLRLAAEFENFRKRTDRERTEGRDRAQGQVIEKLLDVVDDLERVARFGTENATVESLLEGVRMVERKLLRALESQGLEELDPRGERFDPEIHDALMTTGTGEADEDETVGEVFQKGYRFRGGLLRPARVQVRKYEG